MINGNPKLYWCGLALFGSGLGLLLVAWLVII
jgi:hypothetical protein